MKTKLYLHMGPGIHSQVEKHLFELKYPEVDFWNQPLCQNLNELVGAACEKVMSLSQQGAKPVTLIAHSFGGILARLILQTHPQAVKEVILVNSAMDPFECFVNTAPHVLPEKSVVDLPALRKSSVEEKINFIIKIATAPKFNEIYWQSKEKMHELGPVFARYPQLNVETYLKIFSDFLSKQKTLFHESLKWGGKVKIFYSHDDLLLDKNKDVVPWLDVFPQAELLEFQGSGHYLHLEDLEAAEKIFGN